MGRTLKEDGKNIGGGMGRTLEEDGRRKGDIFKFNLKSI